MELLLINPSSSGNGMNESTLYPPLGLGYIASTLLKQKISCEIIDQNINKLSTAEIITRFTEDTKVVGIYVNSFLYDAAKELTCSIKAERPDILVVLGGPLASADAEMLLNCIECDCVIKGEGELSLLVLMQNIHGNIYKYTNVSGAVYKNPSGSIVANPVERIIDLDSIPFPAYDLLPPFGYYKMRSRRKPVAPIITSRGCSFACTFCSKDIYKRHVTFRSAQNVLEEIDYLVKHFKIRQLDILDDNFAQNRVRLESILDGLIDRNYKLLLNMQSGIRTELLDERILIKMKKAGVFKLSFGIESADESVLKLHKKELDLARVEETVKIAKKIGFLVYGFFIIGLPGETEEGFTKTINFAKKLDLDVANFCMAIPFIGTELYKLVEQRGTFLVDTTKNICSGFYDCTVFFEYDDTKADTILARYKYAYKEFYDTRKQLNLLMTIKSFHELKWLLESILFIAKGLFKNSTTK